MNMNILTILIIFYILETVSLTAEMTEWNNSPWNSQSESTERIVSARLRGSLVFGGANKLEQQLKTEVQIVDDMIQTRFVKQQEKWSLNQNMPIYDPKRSRNNKKSNDNNL